MASVFYGESISQVAYAVPRVYKPLNEVLRLRAGLETATIKYLLGRLQVRSQSIVDGHKHH